MKRNVVLLIAIIVFGSHALYAQNASWEYANGPDLSTVISLCLDSHGFIYCTQGQDIIYRSTNNGETWDKYNYGIFNYNTTSIMSLSNDYLVLGSTTGGVFLSKNNGVTWSQSNLNNKNITALNKTSSDLVIAGSGSSLFLSGDYGESWVMSQNPSQSQIQCLWTEQDSVFVGTKSELYIYKTSTGTWTNIGGSLSGRSIVSICRSSYGLIYASLSGNQGLFISSNMGKDWTKVNQFTDAHKVYSDQNNRVYVGSYNNLFTSTNNGVTWDTTKSGYITDIVYSTNNHVYVSLDGGAGQVGGIIIINYNNKLKIRVGCSLKHIRVNAISQSEDALYAGTNDVGVLYTTDKGNSWLQYYQEAGPNRITHIRAESLNSVYAGTYLEGLYHTTDRGKSWHCMGLKNLVISSMQIDRSGRLFVGTKNSDSYKGYGVFCSTDKGLTWFNENDGLVSLDIRSIVIVDDTLYASTWSGLFKAAINIVKWEAFGRALGTTNTIFRTKNGTVFADNYRSTDHGETFTPVISLSNVTCYLETSTGNIFGGTLYHGVYKSMDSGAVFSEFNDGLSYNRSVYALFIDYENNLYAGTEYGILRTAKFVTGINENVNIEVKDAPKIYLYPNPINKWMNVGVRIHKNSEVNIIFYESCGRIIRIMNYGYMSAGYFNTNINIEDIMAGAYFLCLDVGGISITKRINLVK